VRKKRAEGNRKRYADDEERETFLDDAENQKRQSDGYSGPEVQIGRFFFHFPHIPSSSLFLRYGWKQEKFRKCGKQKGPAYLPVQVLI
jgi:hypothetical protein